MLLHRNFSLVFCLISVSVFAAKDASSSLSTQSQHERPLSDGDVILRRHCKTNPESSLCGFVVAKNTETVFPPNSNSIVHSRSERDDSESYLPITSEDLADDKSTARLTTSNLETGESRKKRWIPYGMMGGYGMGYPGMMGGYGMGYPGMMGGYGMGYPGMMGGYGSPFGVHARSGFGVMTPIGPIGAYRSFSLGLGK
ncbi:hypothetical protein L596_001634 [Steinernema carpocapsae]|uniref:Uncharacterized protein n=1 Tax=Steinernema carpocapsae TaxID=34508 RepID=A0A4U8UM35_STECR|nr:hypothetical protein L596_001634 [Steinernema carpocapsae]